MPWPQNTQYNEAIQNLRSAISDDELRQGQPAVNAYDVPVPYSGNFADVYKVHCPATGNTWAVKCFTREVPGLRDRYREISAQLQKPRLSFTVDFHFVEPGIRIGGGWYPFLKMRWVEGISLNQFVGDSLVKPKTLGLLLRLWIKLGTRLRDAGVAHGDLQHGNVLLVPKDEGGKLALKLIDYDGMYVPKLAGMAASEVGHPAYQHPQRLKRGTYNANVDRFSQLAIYCAIRGLMAEQELWAKYDNGDNLLFRETDFQGPETSEVLHQLWTLQDANARTLVGLTRENNTSPRCGRRLLSKTTCLACATSSTLAGSTQEQASSAGPASVQSDEDDRPDLLTRLADLSSAVDVRALYG